MPRLEFWYDFASTYSYLSAMRIEEMARLTGVELVWRPFLLGPIFKAQGWDTSPFNIYPAKGDYMVRDVERLAMLRGLRFQLPPNFPQASLNAARLALIAADEGWVAELSRQIYLLEFRDGADIADPAVLEQAVAAVGQNPASVMPRLQDPQVKAALRAQTERAQTSGIFGAPSFLTEDGELFWGDDRLEMAFAWTLDRTAAGPGSA